jgi:MFS family permease
LVVGRWSVAGRARRLLLTLFLLNLSFAGLHATFPLFSAARFGWKAGANGLLFAFVGLCAVLAQGVLVGRLQARLGDARLVGGGLAALALGLAATGLAPAGWALFPALGAAALGSSLAVPTLGALLSVRAGPDEHGALMGAAAALLSVTQILGPTLAGLAFDHLGPPAPYLLGAALAAGALAIFAAGGMRD